MRLSRPAAVWSLALLHIAGSVAAFVGAAFPMSAHTPRTLLVASGTKSMLLAVVIYVLGQRFLRWAVHPLLSLTMVSMAFILSHAASLAGAVTGACVYLCVEIYAAHFTGRRSALLYAAAGSASFGVALVVAGLPGAVPWVLVSLMLLTIALVISNLVGRLEQRALTDPLTGVLNRSGLVAAAGNAMRAASRSGEPLSLVVLDLDGFKAINDTSGHAAGDRVLKHVSAAWRAQLRPADELARIGGDEFVALLPGVSMADARLVAERLTASIKVACSAGISERGPDDDVHALLARADHEMYRTKAIQRQARRPQWRAG